MSKMNEALYSMRQLDAMAQKNTAIHRLHPLTKVLTTVVYLAVVISFGKYQLEGLIPLIVFPVLLAASADIPLGAILKRVLWVMPLMLGIGIANPIFDRVPIMIGGLQVTAGWIACLSILTKSILTVTVSLLLVATTGMDRLAAALRMLRVPKLFVLQLLLTYRYISVLIEEALRMSRAYALRAPGQRGIRINAWGSFAGQMLLRTFDRAQRIYESMVMRGFHGDYITGEMRRFGKEDLLYMGGWTLFCLTARIWNFPELLGNIVAGVIK